MKNQDVKTFSVMSDFQCLESEDFKIQVSLFRDGTETEVSFTIPMDIYIKAAMRLEDVDLPGIVSDFLISLNPCPNCVGKEAFVKGIIGFFVSEMKLNQLC
jgi:hypothetical protein